jgi:multiple antibiotic resistance protein
MIHFQDLFVHFFFQLFIIVDPLVALPVFLAITPNRTHEERKAIALRGSIIAFFVIVFFLIGGGFLLGYLGIGTSAVRICGGALLFLIGLEMLYGRQSRTETSFREERLAEEKEDVSVTPLAIPLLTGPGAIATTLLFAAKAHSLFGLLLLLLSAAAVFVLTFLVLWKGKWIADLIGQLGLTVLTRVMGLLVAFISVQYIIDGVKGAFDL